LNNSLSDISVKNWDCSSIPNEFGLANWIKITSTIHNSKFNVAKTSFFGGNVSLSDKLQTKSGESKVDSIVLRRP